MATVFAINSMSSRGLLVLNSGHIDPGYEGPITVKAVNLRKVPLTINRGTKIFTIVFYVLQNSTTSPYNQNIPRDRREEQFNSNLVEQDTSNLSEIIAQAKDQPYMTKSEVKDLIEVGISEKLKLYELEVKNIVYGHWLTWLTVFLAFIAAIASILAVILAISPKFQNKSNESLIDFSIQFKTVCLFKNLDQKKFEL